MKLLNLFMGDLADEMKNVIYKIVKSIISG